MFEWALARGVFQRARTVSPGFGIMSATGGKLMSLYGSEAWVYWSAELFVRPEGRDDLFRALQSAGWLDPTLQLANVGVQKKLNRDPRQATELETRALQQALGPFVGTGIVDLEGAP